MGPGHCAISILDNIPYSSGQGTETTSAHFEDGLTWVDRLIRDLWELELLHIFSLEIRIVKHSVISGPQ